MSPFTDDWVVAWRPTWPGLGPCVATWGKHRMSEVSGYWHCTECYVFFALDEHEALVDYYTRARTLELSEARKN